MSLEERLVGGNILDTYDIVGTNFNYFIYQLERITVRQGLPEGSGSFP